jgi:uncharacterized membrane protein
MVVSGLVNLVFNILSEAARERVLFVSVIISIIGYIVWAVIQMGLIKITLSIADGNKGSWGDLFSCYHLFLKYLASSILYFLIVLGGTLLLIVPGIIWSIQYRFFKYFIVDKGCGPVEALKMSSKATYGSKLDIFLLDIVLFGINILGVLALLVGVFVTIPISMLSYAYVFRRISSGAE